MALPLHKMILPYNKHGQENFALKYSVPNPITGGKLPFPWLARRGHGKSTCIKGSLQLKNDYPAELEQKTAKEEKEECMTVKIPEKKLADTWSEIHGANDWDDMLDPLDPLLRSELMRYGEMAQACYDAFDCEPYSKYCGSCKYLLSKFFDCLGLRHGYEVTSYIYATYNANFPDLFQQSVWPEGWCPTANWIGYIATSKDEMSTHLGRRDMTITWPGTMTKLEWIADFMYFLRPISLKKIPCPDPQVKAESGFLNLYTNKDASGQFSKHSARKQVIAQVKQLIQRYKDEYLSITITGHSLGSAPVILSAHDIAEAGVDVMDDGQVAPVCVFSFAGPRVGNIRFKQRLAELGVKKLRVVNLHDKVPEAPGIFFNEHLLPALRKLGEKSLWLYSHVGVELALDHKNSPFLKDTCDIACFHNMEAYLHLLDGCHGNFALTSGRDIALMNKTSNFLKDQFLVPPNWYQSENKGLIRNHENRWVQPDRPNIGDHL